ncbi:BMP family lipoprotein [Bacillus sp. Marseille-P3661]|uniref:BMP family lipoprotein n=1 Tax=Bacillus sp. Marseille-P3661 TaxID=1936234 RepID=UPI000C844A52|nr:BMP family ABC transporter substrate-binding protein [Bacillus sp. Marseille-P3661]
MERFRLVITVILLIFLLNGCGQSQATTSLQDKLKVGMMLADYGLGDQSFNDTAFLGLTKARDELGILFDYRDLVSSKSYYQGLVELIQEEDCDLIIGLGHNMIVDFTAVAEEYPEQQFLFIDQKIELPNVLSITFKEDEGSYLVGIIAGLKTKTNSVGFVGGIDIPVINKFKDGFISGVKAVDPEIIIHVDYANDFGSPEYGKEIARQMIQNENVDIIYPAAGFTGLGVIEEAANHDIFAIGADSDQFYVAEKTVITSMLKNIDVAIYTAIKEFSEEGAFKTNHRELGILENGVGIAPVRITQLNDQEQQLFETYTQTYIDSKIQK